MCAICGIYNLGTGEPVSDRLIKAMANTMIHRGPDAEGVFVSGPVGLGHRRLSIIDLAGGAQPMSNRDGSVWVVFNGEIYNFWELREELEAKGYTFQTRSDTEAIIHLYEALGEACFQRLRGMFAIAIWDARKRQMVLARDRVGKKPLFYAYDGKRLAFASELKALLQLPGMRHDLNPEAVSDFLSLLYIPSPKSVFRAIRKINPGHYAVVSETGVREVEYWDLKFTPTVELPEPEWCERIIQAYKEAVKIRLVSDVPLGAFLSGGVDSSSVVALMSELTGEPVITSSIGFREKQFDETSYARLIAKQFHTKHHEQIVEPDAVKVVEKLVWHYDEPFADSSAVPTYYVSKVAREHVTVVLSGDGGDEHFAGYRRYYFSQREQLVRNLLPDGLRRVLFGTLATVYPKADWAPRFLRGKSTFECLACSHLEGYFRSISAFHPELKAQLLHPDLRQQLGGYETLDLFRHYYNRAGTDDPLSRIQYLDVKTYLTDDILVKVDRASMANSLEVRAPMLDHKFMELVARVPSRLKLQGTLGKYILKKSLESRLPDEVLYRDKMGFGVPLASWLRNDLKDMAAEVLLPKQDDGLLNSAVIGRLWSEHQGGLRDRSTELWALMMFRLWQKQFGGGPT